MAVLAPAHTDSSPLERFLLGEISEGLEAQSLIDTNLAAYAYRVLPPSHPAKPLLRPHRLMLEGRHQLIKAKLLPLVRAWRTAGVRPMLFKGFAFAEFIYPSPGERYYGDVDIIIPQEDAHTALKVAAELDWQIFYDTEDSFFDFRHEVGHLSSTDGLVRIDLHRYPLQQRELIDSGNRRRFTKAAWEKATQRPWEDTTVWLMQPVDLLLMGMLNRAWGDEWGHKPHDLLDIRMAEERCGVTREKLLQRAKELECTLTLELILQTCDPWLGKVHIGTLPPSEVLHNQNRVWRELGFIGLERKLGKLMRIPTMVYRVFPAMWVLQQVKQRTTQIQDMNALLTSLQPSTPLKTHPPRRVLEQIVYGVSNALRFLGPHADNCVPRSLTLYVLLRQAGFEVEFVSGIRRSEGRLEGHAWVEWQGLPVPGFRDELLYRRYKENFRYPKALKREQTLPQNQTL